MLTAITREALREKLEAGHPPILVEALPERHFRQAHLPGAINMPHDRVDDLAPSLLPDRDAEIVVYCASLACRNSGIAARRLAALGYSRVAEYREGKAGWIEAGLPVEGEAVPRQAA